MSKIAIFTLVTFIITAAILIYMQEWYTLAAFIIAVIFIMLRRIRKQIIE